MIPNVLTIAGSDPSGGAGIQADLKTFGALGTYGAAVITALTAQNTRHVAGVHLVPAAFVAAQLDTLFADVRIDALKIGMVATAEIAAAIADRLSVHGARNIVLDPVMVAKSGDRLLDADAVDTLRRKLLPLADVLTPNLPEAGVLLDRPTPMSKAEMRRAAADLHALGCGGVLVKGGHLGGAASIDIWFDGSEFLELRAPRLLTSSTHGTGCTLSAAIAALLPQRPDAANAVRDAKGYVTDAIAASAALKVGEGHGPLHHFYRVRHEEHLR
jgi:hydroxymethylpyrimidine/phosphomethylpyrimidine kinase